MAAKSGELHDIEIPGQQPPIFQLFQHPSSPSQFPLRLVLPVSST